MEKTTARPNRLAGEASLYLRQHAYQPVDWYPWGPEALARAQAEDKPILLSIGYSSCHWCHVMAHESFDNPEIAGRMNQHFVNIKVDREERPDLDEVYMTAVQLIAGQGGWPLTVFLLPDGRPFYGGTYFPPQERHGLPAFPSLLEALSQAYRERRREVERAAEETTRALQEVVRATRAAGPVSADLLAEARAHLLDAYDRRYGGFSVRPKFPQGATLALWARWAPADEEVRSAWLFTLDQMALGGMYDLVGGGFHRYSVDERWLVPHFEKMLYDQALLVPVYLRAYQLTGTAHYRRVAEQTLDYLLREMALAPAGFASAQDADTPEGEGRYYAWTTEEFDAAVGEEDRAWARQFFGVSERGNYQRMTLPRQSMTIAELARRLNTDEEGAWARVDAVRRRLLEARQAWRVPPARDDKLLAGWNGLAIAALAEAGRALGRSDYLDAARRTADFILESMSDPAGRLHHWYAAGAARGLAFLDDYAHVIHGLLELHATGHEPRWLDAAGRLTELVLGHFWDAELGGFFLTSDEHEPLIARPVTYSDLPIPSGNAVMAQNLLRLGRWLRRPLWEERARQTIERFGHSMTHSPQGFSAMYLALDMLFHPEE